MENFRSMSCKEGRMQMENYNNDNNNNNGGGKSNGGPPTSMQDLRSYSTSYASNYMQVHPQPSNKDSKGNNHNNSNNNDHKKNRGFGSTSNSYSNSTTKGWSLSDPELQRKKRVASYKVYAVEGKMKGSFRKSFRWVKHTCSQVVHGTWW
ncbi:hypothetical protein SOVF_045590 [Spinacia oleracea]|uniref:DUF3511 domain-containing protein n=1 Tax=Spinacia oleracea TaxID=3562 RepID=A0ABM3R5N1_SPIOL|nr:uncharacterized protein LOC110802942 [Spinacia oleracea]KNA21171.1 hypothetical protein SOVF_045590 [Spinacia oleracea]